MKIPPFLGVLLIALATAPFAEAQDIDLDASAIDALFAEWNRTDSAGCSLAVIHEGEIVYARGYGMANLDWGIANSPTTVFRIGSTSKQITAACIALLHLDGALSLDDEIQEYVPEIPRYERPITVRHLVHHTSGVRDYLSLMSYAGRREHDWYTTEEALEIVARQKSLNFLPGEQYTYSNSGYLLLGVIVGRVSGKTLREFAQERIFDPLGMRHTHYHDDHTEVVHDRALGYSPADDGRTRIDVTALDMVGDGGVFTTVEDFFLWDQNFYHGEVGGPEFLELIQTPGALNDGEPLDYAFGLGVDEYRGLRTVSHAGGFAGYRAQLIRFPEQRFAVICFANLGTISPSRLCREVADICLATAFPEPKEERAEPRPVEAAAPVQLSREQLQAVVGTYADDEWDVVLEIVFEDDGLVARMGRRRYALRPLSADRFAGGGNGRAAIELEVRREDGEVTTLRLLRSGRDPEELARQEPFEPSAADLAPFAGVYTTEDLLGVRYVIALREDALHLKIGARAEIELTPIPGDLFSSRGFKLRFQRNDDEAPSSFVLDAGRVRGIVFERVQR